MAGTRKSGIHIKRDKCNLDCFTLKRPGAAHKKRRNKCNLVNGGLKEILPKCPLGGDCYIKDPKINGSNPQNCKSCVRFKDVIAK